MKKQYFMAAMAGLMVQSAQVSPAMAARPEGNMSVNSSAMASVKGTVTNEKGEPLPGVNVQYGAMNVQTDVNGKFDITVPVDGKITFTYIGYYPATVNATDGNLDIKLRENSQTLGEVVVTTQKKSQSSIDVPMAVSAMSGSTMDKLNLHQLDDVANFTPGVQIQLQSPNNPGYVIRGVTSDDGESYSQPRVSVFMDGVSMSRSRASAVELYDLERVEVAKGPQGTLFGRGAEIGGISIIRNKPVNYLTGELSLNYGAYNQRQATGFINTPLSDKVANRFAFDYDARDGFIKNLAGGRLNGKNALAFRNSTRWWAGDNTTVDLILDYQRDDYPGTSFKSNKSAYYSNTAPNAPANLEDGKALGIKRNVGGAELMIRHNINSRWAMTSITGFRAFDSDEHFDADGTYLPLLKMREKESGTQLSQELRFNYDDHNRFSGFLGASYFYEHSKQDVSGHANLQYLYPIYIKNNLKQQLQGGLAGINIGSILGQFGVPEQMQEALAKQISQAIDKTLDQILSSTETKDANGNAIATKTPDYYNGLKMAVAQLGQQVGLPIKIDLDQLLALLGDKGTVLKQTLVGLSNRDLSSDYQEQGTNYATNQAAEMFADGTFKITKGLNFTLGVRGTYEHQKSEYSSTTVPSPFGAILYHPTENGAKVSATDDAWSWVGRAALNYMIGRNNIYVSASRGRRPGYVYFNQSPDDKITLRPEIIWSYEFGVKGAVLENSLHYDFCAYYYDWYHFQTSRFDQVASKYVAEDAGRAHSLGIEAGLSYSPARWMNIFGNYAYNDGKFNDTDENGMAQELAGHRFRLTPKHSFAVGLDMNFPVSQTGNIYFRPTYTWKSKVYFDEDNNEAESQKAYGLLNFTAGYRWQPGKVYYEIGAFGKNVLDQKYIVDAGNSGKQIGFPTYVGGSRSVIGAMIKIGF